MAVLFIQMLSATVLSKMSALITIEAENNKLVGGDNGDLELIFI